MQEYLIILFFINFFVWRSQTYKYNLDILEVDWNVTTPNTCDMHWSIVRPSRGVLAITGYIDFKEDINTDNAVGLVNVYYSANGISYLLTPFRIPPTVFTDGVNFFYRIYLKDTMTKCCENAIEYKDKFVAPLTKRKMDCKNCMLRTDNFPSYMKVGYYKFIGTSTGELGFAMALLVKLELD